MIEWLAGIYGVDEMAAALLVVCFGTVLAGVAAVALAIRYGAREPDSARAQD